MIIFHDHMMRSIYYGLTPSYLCNFTRVDGVHTYGIRHSAMSNVLLEIKSHGEKSYMYNGIRLWNGFLASLRSIENKDNFKKKCKAHFFKEMKIF